ncbi:MULTISPECIES: hypothetical protein [unclassified Streptomyces]|uniref:hypothetical protein n=1 Tax=unclassified Streptomyces TaxID=2593676 RepID=UPI002E78F2E9|nr:MULTISPECIES: hypothetical protein [unclassified Streptomyces]MEE1765927.1 hypothetical protein [Streptomyces sp. SP18BB07]MEE1832350.1 hypothetical protein [Streptomyces sp. SP17KL33]
MVTLWIAAAVAGVALAVAFASLFPNTRRGKWEAVLLVLAAAAFAALRALPEGPENENGDPRTALLVFIGAAIYFALMRVSFIGWFRRQEELVRLGRPVEKLKARHYTVMVLGVVVTIAVMIPLW